MAYGSANTAAEPLVPGSIDADVAAIFALQPAALLNAYPIYKRLRAAAPVLRVSSVVLVCRYADVIAVARDTETFSSARVGGSRYLARKAQLDEEGQLKLQELLDHEGLWLTETDRPDHDRLRGLANQAFTPRRIAEMREEIQAIADELLIAPDESGSLELVSELSYLLPLRVICRILGVPAERGADVKRWSREIATAVGTEYSNVDSAYAALEEFREYVAELVAERRESGGSDLFTALVAAEEDGERLSTDELVAMFVLLLFAGHETTTNLISNGMLALVRNPDQLQILRDDPSLTGKAVEELLRYCSSVHSIHRVATRDTELRGVRIDAGDTVRLMIAAANHDEDVFENPEVLDVRRHNAARHIGLGFGLHTCLGAWLARLETEIALTALITRYPDIRLTGEIEAIPNHVLYGPQQVHLTLR